MNSDTRFVLVLAAGFAWGYFHKSLAVWLRAEEERKAHRQELAQWRKRHPSFGYQVEDWIDYE